MNPPSIATAVKQRRNILFSFSFSFFLCRAECPLQFWISMQSLFRAPNFVYIEEPPPPPHIPNRCNIRRIVRCRATDPTWRTGEGPAVHLYLCRRVVCAPFSSRPVKPLRANPDVRPNYLPCKYEVCFEAMTGALHCYPLQKNRQFTAATEAARLVE